MSKPGARPKKVVPTDPYADALCAWRQGMNLSQAGAAQVLGVSRMTIERWERSAWHMPVRVWDIIVKGLWEPFNQPEV